MTSNTWGQGRGRLNCLWAVYHEGWNPCPTPNAETEKNAKLIGEADTGESFLGLVAQVMVASSTGTIFLFRKHIRPYWKDLRTGCHLSVTPSQSEGAQPPPKFLDIFFKVVDEQIKLSPLIAGIGLWRDQERYLFTLWLINEDETTARVIREELIKFFPKNAIVRLGSHKNMPSHLQEQARGKHGLGPFLDRYATAVRPAESVAQFTPILKLEQEQQQSVYDSGNVYASQPINNFAPNAAPLDWDFMNEGNECDSSKGTSVASDSSGGAMQPPNVFSPDVFAPASTAPITVVYSVPQQPQPQQIHYQPQPQFVNMYDPQSNYVLMAPPQVFMPPPPPPMYAQNTLPPPPTYQSPYPQPYQMKKRPLPVRPAVLQSERMPFVFQGKVYPPGLNRKDYRAIVHHSDETGPHPAAFQAPEGTADGDLQMSEYYKLKEKLAAQAKAKSTANQSVNAPLPVETISA